jgi:thiol:disulfide interchange protein DsbC
MIKKRISPLVGFLALCFTSSLWAADAPWAGSSLLNRQTPEQVIAARLLQARPDIKISSIKPSAIAGLYQAQVTGGPLLYVSPDGDKFIAGDMFTVGSNGFAKYEDPSVIGERKKLLSSISEKDAIVFKTKEAPKAVIYVFTDVDCGYCRRLNSQMTTYTDERGQQKLGYNDLGIEVRYLAFPRAGVPSASADKLVTAWCSKDKQQALTLLKKDQAMAPLTCENPVAAQYELGVKLGVNGTPAIWLPSGEIQPGYIPPEDLARELKIL